MPSPPEVERRRSLFPDAWAAETDYRVGQFWDLDYPLPMPKAAPLCPMCSPFSATGGRMVVKDWKFHQRQRTGTSHPWRCDVRTKCLDCGGVQIFGVRVSRDYYKAAASKGAWIPWRSGKQTLAKAGYFEEEPDEQAPAERG